LHGKQKRKCAKGGGWITLTPLDARPIRSSDIHLFVDVNKNRAILRCQSLCSGGPDGLDCYVQVCKDQICYVHDSNRAYLAASRNQSYLQLNFGI
jgi:hypothetical protein